MFLEKVKSKKTHFSGDDHDHAPNVYATGEPSIYPETSTHNHTTDQTRSHRNPHKLQNRLSNFQYSIINALLLITTAVIVILHTKIVSKTQDNGKVVVEERALAGKHASLIRQSVMSKESHMKSNFYGSNYLIFKGSQTSRQYAVVQSFKHAWKGYKEHAWGHDYLQPVSGTPADLPSLGLTIVDGIDTAYIMGLTKEYEQGRNWIEERLDFSGNKRVNFFEVTIRVLGALLTNYHFSRDQMFLDKARNLGERLMVAFSSPSGIPYSDLSLGPNVAYVVYDQYNMFSVTSEVTSVQLEFRELSRVTGDPKFERAAAAVSEKVHNLPKRQGLVQIYISPTTGRFMSKSTITLGARGDSYYECLLKQWLQTGKSVKYLLDDYLAAIEGVKELLAKRSSVNNLLFIGELMHTSSRNDSEIFNAKMDHLTCFLPGTLALGYGNGLPYWHMIMAEELLYTCYKTYAAHPTFLSPEITYFRTRRASTDMYTKAADAHTLLRPEFVESLWYMYQITGNTTYQDWGWEVFQAFEKYAKTPLGYSSLDNVTDVDHIQYTDLMESFFLSETLKYMYLLFSNDRYYIDLSKYVFNTEGHPLPLRPHY